MFVDKSYIFMLFTFIVGAIFFLLVPKAQYKRYLLYGIVLGGFVHGFIASASSYMNLLKYTNMGPFSVLGVIPAWTPIAWSFSFAVFFYLMPRRRAFLIPYLLAFTGLDYIVGLVLEAYGLFTYIGSYRYFALLTFLVWYSVAAWIFYRDPQANVLQPVAAKVLPEEKRDEEK